MKNTDLEDYFITIPSSLQHIQIIEDYIENIRCAYNIDDCVYGNIHLAIVEAVTNAIVHGNKLNIDKKVTFQSEKEETCIRFIVRDQGEGFDLKSVPDPTLPENKLKLNGRGVFLIRHLADKVCFENDGACIQMTFKLN
ncbi:MAG: ATP-binding protein [Chitinophagales bacterium]|nr:ATP-binding protein [Chitinophagales bacterium]